VELLGNDLVFQISQHGNYNISAFSLNGKLLDTMSIDLPMGETKVALDRLPNVFHNATIIQVRGADLDRSFKLGLRQP
jgi:hypothetical protein